MRTDRARAKGSVVWAKTPQGEWIPVTDDKARWIEGYRLKIDGAIRGVELTNARAKALDNLAAEGEG